ncbi:MAG: cbb3-type cytochrome c oxidase subunit I, partial [Casimicrobiaceae bacterium]
MRYRSQSVAYWYFAVAMVLFGLQLVFGLLSAAKYVGPDPLLNILPFDVTKVIHTNLLIVWVLTGFMGATYWMVPDESRTELYSTKLAYVQLILWTLMGVTAVVGYLFRYGTGNKLLEQPLPHKIVIVICMLIFLYNIGMTIWQSKRFTTTEGVLVLGLALGALLYLPALLEYENYTVSIYYRWWTIHLWVEGVWVMIQGGFLAYLLIRALCAEGTELREIVFRPRNLELLANTLLLTGSTLITTTLVALPLGYLAARTDLRPRRALMLAGVLPLAIPGYVG